MIPRPPRPTLHDTLLPYTTRFRSPLSRRLGFRVDQVAKMRAHVERRHGDEVEPFGFNIAGDVIEQLRRIASRARIGGEEAEVGIDARGDRMIIDGAEMAIDRKRTRMKSSH